MEYASQTSPASQLGGSAVRDQRPLETLSDATLRVNSAVVKLSNFLDRWHGQAQPEIASKDAPEPYGYSPTLGRLFEALERLEDRVRAVESIG
jgi:hypothetical protein